MVLMSNYRRNKDNSLLIYSNREVNKELLDILDYAFTLVFKNGKDECLEYLLNNYRSVAAILIDIDIIRFDNYAFTEQLSKDPLYLSIPILALTDKKIEEEDLDFLIHGVSEVLNPPYLSLLVFRRIFSSVRAKDSLSFHEIEKILKQLPSNICLKDDQGRYIFATHNWHHIDHSDDQSFTIRGKTDLDVRKNKENAMKAYLSDQQLLKSGKGTRYIIKEEEDGIVEYLELIKEPTYDAQGKVNGIISLINDVTDVELLRQELEKRSATDQLTGLYNRSATVDKINEIIAKGKENCALMMIDIDKFKSINDSFGHIAGDEVLKAMGSILHDSTKGMDVAGRLGGDEFVIFLREVSDEKMIEHLANNLNSKAENTIFDNNPDIVVSLSIGIAKYPEHGNNFEELYHKADEALYYVKGNGKGSYRICDFKS